MGETSQEHKNQTKQQTQHPPQNKRKNHQHGPPNKVGSVSFVLEVKQVKKELQNV